MWQIILLCLLVGIHSEEMHVDLDDSIQMERYRQKAQTVLDEWNSQKDNSLNPTCWERAALNLQTSCDKVDKEARMRFAWDVMNCFLDDAGRKRYICKAKMIKTCTSKLPDSVLQIYTQFVNHADSICFYQEFQNWQKKMDSVTDQLVHNSEKVNDNLSHSVENQQKLLSQQDVLYEQQREVNKQSMEVLDHVVKTQSDVTTFFKNITKAFTDARENTESAFTNLVKSIDWLFSKMESIDALQSTLMTIYTYSSSWLQLVIWIVLIYMLTAVPGLTRARPFLYGALFSSVFAKLVVHYIFAKFVKPEVLVDVERWTVRICLARFCWIAMTRSRRKKQAPIPAQPQPMPNQIPPMYYTPYPSSNSANVSSRLYYSYQQCICLFVIKTS